jgi:predicted metal-binding protein
MLLPRAFGNAGEEGIMIANDQPECATPLFVPVALRDDEAHALLNAARSIFQSLTALGLAATDGGELARGMVTLAKAIEKAEEASVSQ